MFHGNGFVHRDTRDTQSIGELRRSRSSQDIYRQSGHFDGSKLMTFSAVRAVLQCYSVIVNDQLLEGGCVYEDWCYD